MSRTHELDAPQAQAERVARFITAYNAIDKLLRAQLKADNGRGFASLVEEFEHQRPRWRSDVADLKVAAQVRNFLQHEDAPPNTTYCVPVEDFVVRVEAIQERLANPPRVHPKYARKVVAVALSDALTDVLVLVRRHDFSQFPVYDRHQFQGLLTENGITRWLAAYTHTESLVEFDDARVADVLAQEETRKAWAFIPRDLAVEDAARYFGDNLHLEALLITQSGKTTEQLVGIMTRSDVAELARSG